MAKSNPCVLISTLGELSGGNTKKMFVQNHAHEEEFTYLLQASIDSMKKTGISKLTYAPPLLDDVYKDKFSEFRTLFESVLITNRSNALIQSVEEFLGSCSKLEYEVYYRIFTRTMKLGISTKGVNSVMGAGFVSEFKIQLALPMTAETELNYPILSEEKLNGVRLVFFKDKGRVSAMTRQGHPINLPRHFKILEKIPDDNFILDGELKARGMLHKTVSIVTKLVRGTAQEGAEKILDFFAYDFVPLDIFRKLGTSPSLEKRVSALEAMLMSNQLMGKGKCFYRPESRLVNSRKELNKFFKDIKDAGGEGLVVKELGRPYEFAKTTAWLKYKAVYSTTLLIVDVIQGSFGSKYQDTLGAFQCVSSDSIIDTNVGSGIPDDLRQEVWDCPVAYKGKLIEVLFTDINYTEDGDPFLDFPRYTCFRIEADKDKADTFEDIKAEIAGVNNGTR